MALMECRFFSKTLGLSTAMNVILPSEANPGSRPPALLYLLHGWSDDHTIWERRTSIERYVADYPLAIVMPAVNKSFYCDMAYGPAYWKFISEEVPTLVKTWFNVSSDRGNTFVAGISMGGYGAFKLALTFPDRFAAAASLSGALDIARHIHDEIEQPRLNEYLAIFGHTDNIPGSENDLLALLDRLKETPRTKFYACCGTEDFLYPDYRAFREKANETGLDLLCEEGPGDHNWEFWDHWIQRVIEWLPVEKIES